MAGDFLRLVARPANLLVALRRITVGGLLTAAGLHTGQAFAAPSMSSSDLARVMQAPPIVDRSRKRPALLLRLPDRALMGDPQHRSHRSHSSHRSSSGGGSVAPPVAPRRTEPAPTNRLAGEPAPPTTNTTPTTSALAAASLVTVSGVVETIDRQARTISVRLTGSPTLRIFAYRDDSKIETVTGSSIRFDEFGEMSGGQIPVAKDDKVRVAWRTSADGKTQVLTSVTKTP